MALSENVKQTLGWICEAAKQGQLAVLEVTHKKTREVRPAIVVALERDNKMEFYPVGFVAEDIGELMDEWSPPDAMEETNENPTGESASTGD